jgi:hypothetical protein
MFLLATTNAIHLIIAFLVAQNLLYPVPYQVHECSIGFSGVIFSMLVRSPLYGDVSEKLMMKIFDPFLCRYTNSVRTIVTFVESVLATVSE